MLYWFRQLSANTVPCSMPRQSVKTKKRKGKKMRKLAQWPCFVGLGGACILGRARSVERRRGKKRTFKLPEIHIFLARKKRKKKRQ